MFGCGTCRDLHDPFPSKSGLYSGSSSAVRIGSFNRKCKGREQCLARFDSSGFPAFGALQEKDCLASESSCAQTLGELHPFDLCIFSACSDQTTGTSRLDK